MTQVLERQWKEGEIVATVVTKRYIYFARVRNGHVWFGIQPHNQPELVQWVVADHLRHIDEHRLFNKKAGVYTFAPYRYVVTVDRIWAIDAPKEGIRYVTALSEKLLMKLLFFMHSVVDIYNEGK